METRLARIERAIGLAIRIALLITLVFIAWILWYDLISGGGINFNVDHDSPNYMHLIVQHAGSVDLDADHTGSIDGPRCAP